MANELHEHLEPEERTGEIIESFVDLRRQHPDLNAPVIDGLLRQGEVANIVAASKVGKSWFAYGIALSIITGRRLFEAFPCSPGPVLLIDNELHPSTLSHRIAKVGEAMGLGTADYAGQLDVLPLRGKGVTLPRLAPHLENIETGRYRAIILDAWYRLIPAGMNENSNADVMQLYNTLDGYAADTAAAWLVVHHSSKGAQGEKSVTDVGAGAGAQSRAADSHLILREHEEGDGAVVLEAAVRSFKPVAPIGLRWEFPLWRRAYDLNTDAVKGRKSPSEERQSERDAEGMNAIRRALQGDKLTPRRLREQTGLSRERVDRLLNRLHAEGEVTYRETKIRGNPTREYELSNGRLPAL